MRRGILVLLALLASLVAIPPAQAGSSIDANTFATSSDFCGDGSVTVVKTLVVQGGTGTFAAGCNVTLSDKSQLKLIDATLSGPGAFIVSGGIAPKVDVKQTTLTMGDSVQIRPGCCDAGFEGARLQVIGSHVESTTFFVELSASAFSDDGRVQVNKSTIRSGLLAGDSVMVLASDTVSSTGGKVLVTNSTLDAGQSNINVETYTGSTQVKKSTLLAASGIVITAFGGKCKSQDNVPDTPCS